MGSLRVSESGVADGGELRSGMKIDGGESWSGELCISILNIHGGEWLRDLRISYCVLQGGTRRRRRATGHRSTRARLPTTRK